MKRFLWFIFPIIFAITLWEVISQSGFLNSALFPSPYKVASALWSMIITGTIFSDIRDSLWRLFAGLFLGSLMGIFLGLLTGRVKFFASVFSPLIQLLRPLPAVAIIPLVIVWFGIDDGAKIFSISFAVFFPVWINAHVGAQQIPRAFLWSAKLLTRSTIKTFRNVIFPATLPFIIVGVRTGIAIGFVMVFVSELAGASSGLGYRISITHLAYRIDAMIAALIVLGALGATVDQLFVFFTNRFFTWLKFSSK
ncbi:ABC transporter permease [Patescibacteria group bacterium]|nr:ABC transporter permease [Patescibacteria group bacterium]